MHRYFPDFVVKTQNKNGKVMTYVLEVKPEVQTKMPSQKRKTKRFLQEAATYAINQEKWKAADIFCKEHGWEFKILTERDLGLV
jgi:predicted TIM-barrel fold metal-dependent hydrolase